MLSSSEDITNPRSSNPFFPLSYLLFFFFLLYCSFQPQPLVFFLIVAPPCAPVRGRKKKNTESSSQTMQEYLESKNKKAGKARPMCMSCWVFFYC